MKSEEVSPAFESVYQLLRGLAHRQLAKVGGHTLNTTALVHEAWLKLSPHDAPPADRGHFFALAATAMRQIVVDHARRRKAHKRSPGPDAFSTLDDVGVDSKVELLLAVDEVLVRLGELDERLAQVVLLRFFGGLEETEIGEALKVDPRTVRRDWRKARAFIVSQLSDGG